MDSNATNPIQRWEHPAEGSHLLLVPGGNFLWFALYHSVVRSFSPRSYPMFWMRLSIGEQLTAGAAVLSLDLAREARRVAGAPVCQQPSPTRSVLIAREPKQVTDPL